VLVREPLSKESEEREGKESAVVYRGFAHLPEEDVALDVRVELPSGATTAALTSSGGEGAARTTERDNELAKAAAALIRSATKAAVTSGGPLPRKIVRWR
jgi:hypothetical protein